MVYEELLALPGVGPSTAAALTAAGFDGLAALEAASVSDLLQVSGFGQVRAQALLEAVAGRRAPVGSEAESDPASGPDTGPSDRTEQQGSSSTGTKKQSDKAEKRRAKVRRKLDRELDELRAQRADVKARMKKSRRRLGKVDSKKRRKKAAEELARFRKQSRKLKRRIDEVTVERRRAGG